MELFKGAFMALPIFAKKTQNPLTLILRASGF